MFKKSLYKRGEAEGGSEVMAKSADGVNLYENEFLEDMFSIAVLHKAKELFGEKAKYLTSTRMVKLVAFVSDDVDFDLTRGWYRYGYYSQNAYTVIKDYSEGNILNLDIPKEMIEKSLDKFSELLPKISDSIKNLKPDFIQDRNLFYDWIYETKAPEEFKGLYRSHRDFQDFFTRILTFFRLSKKFTSFDYVEKWNQDTIIRDYYRHLNHLKDDEILNIFCDFMDLFEMVMLRMKNKNYLVNEDSFNFLERLKENYCGSGNDLWTLLVPYSETLKGRRAEDEKICYREQCELVKAALPQKIEILTGYAESMDLLPSIEEMEVEIKRYDSKEERMPLREICARV